MKTFAIFALITTAVALTPAWAQNDGFTATPVQPHSSSGNTYVGGGGGRYGGYHSSTAAEGRLRGMGSLVRSAGQANLDNSGAAINYSIARRNHIENQAAYTDTYFAMRETNREYRERERGPRPTEEDFIRFAQSGMPKRLSPSELDTVNGSIQWPVLLRTESLAPERSSLEQIFAKRASTGTVRAEDYTTVTQDTDKMMKDLKGRIREVPSNDYLIARNFIRSLAYVATLPVN